MAVHSLRSNVSDKLKKFGKSQKESIKESLYTKGEFPILIQILCSLLFWFVLFLIFAVVMTPTLRWLGVFLAVIGAFLIIQSLNFLGRKFINKDLDIEEEIGTTDILEIEQNSIILGDLYKKGGLVLVNSRKGKLKLTPMVLLQIHSVSSSSTSVFGSLSSVTIQKLSLKYHCSVIDTSKYELILLKGESRKCKKESLSIMIQLLKDRFFQEAFDIISEFQREKRIEVESPKEEILAHVFPSYENVINLNATSPSEEVYEPLNQDSDISELEVETRELYEIFSGSEHEEIEEEQEEQTVPVDPHPVPLQVEKKQVNPNQQLIVKDVLLRELNFSIESFVNAAKGYYKKGIETNLEKKYDIDVDKFLKLTQLFCDKEEIPYFYPSYSYLLKIIEFLEIELPSSTDIENFSTKLAEEYVSTAFPEDYKNQLIQFLDSKAVRFNSKKNEEVVKDNSKITSIPPPPSKGEVQALIQEESE